MSNFHKAIIFYNEKSGQSDWVTQINAIQTHFTNQGFEFKIVDVPLPASEISGIIKQGEQEGVDLIVAAGGDGTVAMVSSPLVGTNIPLGIIPIGTGNLIAKELMIPVQIEKALKTISSEDSERFSMDTLNVGQQNFLMNLSVGISSTIMDLTPSEEKQRLGFLAYLRHFIRLLFRIKMDRFTIDYDGQHVSKSASEVIVSNCRTLAKEIFTWPDSVILNDGKLDLFIIRAANLRDVLRFIASVFSKYRIKLPIVDYYQFEKDCLITTKEPKKVQADGDSIGETPVRIRVQPQSLQIIVPSAKMIRSSIVKH